MSISIVNISKLFYHCFFPPSYQARAPNSPVLIVGTHYDLVRQKFPPSWSEDLQQLIRERFINVIDADKLGLPRVLDTIEVNRRENFRLMDSVFKN